MNVRSIEDAPEDHGASSHMGSEVRSLAEAIGDEEFTWDAPDGLISCTFGRPKGFVTLQIADALGSDREQSTSWVNTYRALAGIRTWNGNMVSQPRKAIGFEAALQRFDIGNGCEDLYLNQFVYTFHTKTNPALAAGLAEIEAEQLGAEDASRVMDEIGKAPAKKSRARNTSHL